jgi:hypothetical protein
MDGSLNWLAVVVAAVVYFLLGWLWYTPAVFGKAWMAAAGIKPTKPKPSQMVRLMGLTLLLGVVMASALGLILRAVHADTVSTAICWAAVAAVGFAASVQAMGAQYEQRSLKYFAITAGYPVVGAIAMSIVLTLWK